MFTTRTPRKTLRSDKSLRVEQKEKLTQEDSSSGEALADEVETCTLNTIICFLNIK